MITTLRKRTGVRRGVRTIGGVLAAGALTLSIGACGAKNSNDEAGEGGGGTNYAEQYTDCTPGEGSKDVSTMDPDGDKKLTVAAFNGWDESFAAAHLLKYVLSDEGYDVDIQSLDAGPGYTGIAQGDIDVIMDGWAPKTHVDYINQYHDDIEFHGCWYNKATLNIAVNEDSPAKSIADLKDMGDDYGKRLVGIEPSAGETEVVKNNMIPAYGLEDWNFQTSSTPAMLAELKKATSSGDDIAVTLWHPQWAYDAFPVRDLEDPEGAMGGAENIINFSRSGLGDDKPYVSQLLQNLAIDDEHLQSLENVMFSDDNYGGENLDKAVDEWAKTNKDFFDDWKAGALGGK
jgi:glycine betaine/proline transport system substrate-binding protein